MLEALRQVDVKVELSLVSDETSDVARSVGSHQYSAPANEFLYLRTQVTNLSCQYRILPFFFPHDAPD